MSPGPGPDEDEAGAVGLRPGFPIRRGKAALIDVFDICAFVVLAVLLAAALVIVVLLGSLPGWIARKP